MKSNKRTGRSGKIMVRAWPVVLDDLDKRVEAVCLRRDAFLERVISREVEFLSKEVRIPNSDAARRCIEDNLNLLDCRSVNLTLTEPTVTRMEEVCREKNIPRDAFINRVLLCLVAPPSVLDVIFHVRELKEEVLEEWETPGLSSLWSPLRTMAEFVEDPFWFVRACMGVARKQPENEDMTFYQSYIPDKLFGEKIRGTLGLNVYLPDGQVPGHPAERALLDDLGAELDKLLQKKPKARKGIK